ncbi:unnamed protein product [Anisakis simplex]|uniref:SAE2 domain-containing protein n=1 Tax=Anisakis simplex TaxID=6269 RepID=A0A0M3KA78_ANISI|nr:unnamed protein product [Anisakis simplex]
MAQLRGVIDSKTRQLLVADRDLHLANERVISIQKKLEDKLFVATNTKCTTCNVFDKYRDVLTTQIADKTAALADANVILNDVRMKLDKQERASKILSRENDKMKFERDIWMADSKRLENEVRLLRAQLSASSAIENNSTNSVNNNTSTPSDGSGSVHRLFGDSKAISGGISDAHNSPATSSSTPQNLQSPVFGQDKSVCPPPPELPSLVGKFRHSNSSSDSSKAKVSCMPSLSSKRDNNSRPSSQKQWKSNSTTRAHYAASKTNGQTIQRPSRTTTRLSEDTNNKTAKSDIGEEKLEREKSWKKETKTVGERSSKAIDSVSECTTTKSHSTSPDSSSKTDLSKSSKQTSQSEEKSSQKRMDDESKTTQPNSNSKKALIVPPPKDESEISSASTSDSKCETRSAKSENKSGRASADSEQKPRPDSNKKSHPPKSLFSSLAGHSRWPDVMQPHSSGSSKKRKRHELMEQDEEMMLWRVSEQRRKDDEHWRRLRAADGVRLEGDEEGDAEEFRFRPNDHFNNSRAPPPMMDSMGAAEPLFANDPFCNRKSSPIFMVDETRSPVNEFPTWRSTRRGGLLDGERSPHFIDFDHDRPRTECDERWTMARSEPLNGRFERRELPIGRVDGYRPMLVPPTDHFGRASFSDREVWHQGMLMDSPFNDSADIRHDERWRDTPSDWTFEDFGFAGRGFRPM